MSLSFTIKVMSGPSSGQAWQLTRRETVVGRGEEADLPLADEQASRQHCKFVVSGQRVRVVDLASTNGTWHNGQRVDQAELVSGDVVRVGGSELAFSVSEAAPAGAETPEAAARRGGAAGVAASLGWRGMVLGLVGLVSLVSFLLAALPLVRLHGEDVGDQALGRAGALVVALAALNREALRLGDEMLVEDKSVARANGVVQAYVYDRHGRTWAPVSQIHQVPGDPASRRALEAEQLLVQQIGPSEYDIAEPIRVFDPGSGRFEKVGTARIVFSLGRLEALGAGTWRTALLWLVAALALAAGAGYALLRLFTAPLRRLRDDLESVLKGDRADVGDPACGGEGRALAESINRGLAKLAQEAASSPAQPVIQVRGGDDACLSALALAVAEPVLMVDAENRVTMANPAFSATFGVDQADLVGSHLLEALPDAALLTAVLEMVPQAQAGAPVSRELADHAGRPVRLHMVLMPGQAGQGLMITILGHGPASEAQP